jgi:hypothetical protein
MHLLKTLRIVLVLNVFTMLLQAAFAGRMLTGERWAVHLHEVTARGLVLVSCGILSLIVALRMKGGCPRWVPIVSGLLVAAEIVEFGAGQLHHVALHVPLGMAIFGGAMRLLFWSVRETGETQPIEPGER